MDLIDNNKDGILVVKEEPLLMVNEIHKIIEKNNISLTINARTKVENYDWSVVRNQWLNLLK